MSSAVFLLEEKVQNMNDFGFWDLFWPMLAALVTSVVIFESTQLGFSYWMARRQLKKYLEFQEKVKSGEIKMSPELIQQMAPGMMGSVPFDFPTTSGSDKSVHSSGQYL